MSRSWDSGSWWMRRGWRLLLPRFPVRDHVMSGGDGVSAWVIWRSEGLRRRQKGGERVSTLRLNGGVVWFMREAQWRARQKYGEGFLSKGIRTVSFLFRTLRFGSDEGYSFERDPWRILNGYGDSTFISIGGDPTAKLFACGFLICSELMRRRLELGYREVQTYSCW